MSCVIDKINFFPTPHSCIHNFEEINYITKALQYIKSFANLFYYHVTKINLFFYGAGRQIQPYTKASQEGFSKKTLVVALHGLNNGPLQFAQIVDEINRSNLSSMEIYIPYLKEKGNAKLDEIVQPIFENIKIWAEKNGDKKLILIGVSNGARVAKDVVAQLTKTKSVGNIKCIQFLSIVGANKGSCLVNLVNTLGLSQLLLSNNIATEMPVNSERNRQLDKDFTEGVRNCPNLHFDCTFFAAPWYSDWQVPDYNSTLMEMPQTYKGISRYAIIGDEGHNSIVNRAAKAAATLVTNQD